MPDATPPNKPNTKPIRFCINNPRSLEERESLLSRQDTQSRDCLSNCTRCFETRFLEINNELIETDDYSTILPPPQSTPPPQSVPPAN